MSNVIRDRKIELMKLKREDKSKDVLERSKIIGLLEAKYNELVREGKEDVALTESTTKVKKDLEKEKESYVKGNREELVEAIDIQIDEVVKLMPKMMDKSDIAKLVNDLMENDADNNFGKMMGKLSNQLKGKADMKDVKEVLQEQMGLPIR